MSKSRAGSSSRRARHIYDPDRRVVAVTGVHSYLGRELLRRLEDNPRYVRVLALDVRAPDGLSRAEFHRIDLTWPNAGTLCARLLQETRADTFIHTAFLSGPTHSQTWAHELEVIGTIHVLSACAEAGVRKYIHWSSTGVYGPHPTNPNFLAEGHPLKGLAQSRYFNDRVEAEREVQRFAEENPSVVVTVLRTAPMLGRHMNNFVSRFFQRPLLPVLMGSDPLLQFVHESDAVDAFVIACDGDFPGAFNIVGDGVLPYTSVIARLGKVPVPIPHFVAYPLCRILWSAQIMESPPTFLDWLRYLCVADGRRARHTMGFLPRYDIRQTVDDFAGRPVALAAASDVHPPPEEIVSSP